MKCLENELNRLIVKEEDLQQIIQNKKHIYGNLKAVDQTQIEFNKIKLI
jgi:flagellar biosynthesis/type III secretory pathway chaperone